MSLLIQESGDRFLVQLEDSITISCATELRNLLVEALDGGKRLEVDLTRTTEIDLSAIQLLHAAQLASAQAGVSFTSAGPVPDTVREAIEESGIGPIFESPRHTVE